MTKASERLRDEDASWGLTRIEYSLREKQRVRDRNRARRAAYLQTIKIRERNDKGQFVSPEPVDNVMPFRLKAKDIQDLGIIAVPNKYTNISLPFVSILHGEMR